MKYSIVVLFSLVVLHLSANEIARKDTFQQKIQRINYYLSIYDTLFPFCGDDSCYERISMTQEKILGGLLDILNDRQILKYDLNLTFSRESISHSASADGRVHFFSISEKTGGTYQSNLTILHVRSVDGNVSATLLNTEEPFGYSYFSEVYLLDSVRNTYIAIGGAVTCTSCLSMMAILISPDSTTTPELVFQADLRMYEPYEMNFNDTTKTLTYFFASRSDDPLFGDYDNGQLDVESPVLNRYGGEYSLRRGKFVKSGESWYSEEIEE